jgi:haloalkane dehalogenase
MRYPRGSEDTRLLMGPVFITIKRPVNRMQQLSAKFPYAKQFLEIDGLRLACVDVGEGNPIVLLHGNPTSSYLWRNVIPHLQGSGRVIVPDLVGQGDSGKLDPALGPDRYSFAVVYDLLCKQLAALGVTDNVTLVVHDWGSALGFHWASQHRDAVRGIAYMEAIVMPLEWSDWPEHGREIFQGFRAQVGEELILERNLFIEAVLPSSIIRDLGEEELAEYRRPFPTPADRQPLLNWPRQIPLGGEPAHMVTLVEDYAAWLAGEDSPPKLFVNADPGSILVGRPREFCRSWPNQTEVTVKGLHFVQEDSPHEIGHAVADWLADQDRALG